MTEEADRIIDLLLMFTGSTEYCEEADMAYDAIDLIEELSAKVEELTKDRDQWKRRAEAAERDLQKIESCNVCKHALVDCITRRPKRYCFEWRGPCPENSGGGEDA